MESIKHHSNTPSLHYIPGARTMWIIKLAWRNLWRNKRRTLITISSICFGLVLAIVFIGLGDGTYGTMIDSAARLGSGHITLENPGYRKSLLTRLTLRSIDEAVKRFETIQEIEGWAPRILGQAMLSTSYGSVGAAFIGVNPEQEKETTLFIDKVIEGTYLKDSEGRGTLIGKKMAARLKVSIGSKMVITANNLNGEIAGELLRVVGIFETGSEMIDGYIFQIPLNRARKLLGMNQEEVTQLAIFLENQRDTEHVIEKLKKSLSDLEKVAVLSWREIMPELASYVDLDGASNYILQIIIFTIIAAGILNTILMSVMERQFEFGVLLSLGMNPLNLLFLILAESALLGLLGVTVGSALGLACNHYFTVEGVDMTLFTREGIDISGVALDPVLHSNLYPDHLIIITVLVFLMTIVVGIYPAVKAARSVPIEVLKKGQ
jgi:ABC-type lipoprotein release transport system permease subunit